MNAQEKTRTLIQAARAAIPEAGDVDFNKNTPLGLKIKKAIDAAARKLFSQTGDKEWVKIGAEMSKLGRQTKPSPDCETK